MKYLGLVAVGVMGCASVEHVTVTPLPQNPTPPQRMWFWDNYRPIGDVEEVITTCRRTGACSTTRTKVIQLADRRIVRDPEDLAPLLAPDSRTLSEARSSARSRANAHWWALGTVAGLVAGLVIAVDGHNSNDDTELGVGVGIGAGSVLVGAIATYIIADNARAAHDRALGWYPHDLADQLHLCFNGVTVVPCETITPGAPPPAPAADPNLDQLRQR